MFEKTKKRNAIRKKKNDFKLHFKNFKFFQENKIPFQGDFINKKTGEQKHGTKTKKQKV